MVACELQQISLFGKENMLILQNLYFGPWGKTKQNKTACLGLFERPWLSKLQEKDTLRFVNYHFRWTNRSLYNILHLVSERDLDNQGNLQKSTFSLGPTRLPLWVAGLCPLVAFRRDFFFFFFFNAVVSRFQAGRGGRLPSTLNTRCDC